MIRRVERQEVVRSIRAAFTLMEMLVVVAIRVLFWSMGDVANDRKWGVYAISRLGDVSFGQYAGSLLIANGAVALGQLGILLVLKQILGPQKQYNEQLAVAKDLLKRGMQGEERGITPQQYAHEVDQLRASLLAASEEGYYHSGY